MDTTALYYLFMDWRHVGNLNAAAKRNGLISRTYAFGLRPTQAWDRFIDHNMNLSVSTVAVIASKTISSLGVPGAIAPMWVYEGVNSFSVTRADDLTDHPTIKPTQMIADIIMIAHQSETGSTIRF